MLSDLFSKDFHYCDGFHASIYNQVASPPSWWLCIKLIKKCDKNV